MIKEASFKSRVKAKLFVKKVNLKIWSKVMLLCRSRWKSLEEDYVEDWMNIG